MLIDENAPTKNSTKKKPKSLVKQQESKLDKTT